MLVSGPKAWFALVLMLLVALACEKPTPVAPAESGLSISANPTRIDIDGSTEITVIARKVDGTAVNPGTEITFTTTLGTITPKVALTDDRGTATATLTGDGRVGIAMVEASSGAATLAMLEIQIGAQPTSLGLQANPVRLPKDGGSTKLVAQVLDDLGNALQNVLIRFSTEAGTLDSGGSAVPTNKQGESTDTLTLTAFDVGGVPEGFFLVSAETVDALGAPLIADFEVEIGGFVATVTLTTSPGTVSPSGGEFLLTAVVQDDSGDLVEDEGVIFSSDAGSLASAGRQQSTDADGVATDFLTLSPIDLDAFTGSAVNVSATSVGLGNEQVVGEDQILISTSVGILTLSATPLTITTDVTSTISLTASVFDDTGAAVVGAGVSFFQSSTCLVNPTCSAGDLADPGLVVTGATGQAFNSLTITAAQIEDPGTMTQDTATITVTAEGILQGQTLSDSITVTIVPP
jgi:hypothetical protein